jgi:hypothetical protein
VQTLSVAVEQSHAHRGLELLDPLGDVRRHAVQFARGFDDSAFLHDNPEDLQIREVDRTGHSILI